MKRKIIGAVLLTLLSQTAMVGAETLPAFEFDNIIVTATRTPQSQSDISNASLVIGRDAIEKSGARNLGELLEGYPGISLQRKDSRRFLSLRGFDSRYCLVLIDGKRLPAEPEKDFEMDRILLEDVERVEVVRGPLSGLYGSDALGGVVNIITRSASRRGATFNLRGGHADGVSGIGTDSMGMTLSSGKQGKVAGAVTAESVHNRKHLKDDGTTYEPFGRRNYFSGRMSYDFDDRSALYLDASYLKERNHEYGTFRSMMGPLSMDFHNRDSRNLYSLRYLNNGDNAKWDVRAYRSVLHKYNDIRNRKLGVYTNAIYALYTINGLEAQHTVRLDDSHTLTMGGELRSELFSGTGINTGRGEYVKTYYGKQYKGSEDKNTYYGIYLQDQWDVSPELSLVGSLRYDGSRELDSRLSPKLGATYRVNEDWSLKLNAGQGFKAPTPNQRFLDLFVMRSGRMASVKGNPDLKSEKADSWDITTEHRIGDNTLALTYFDNHVKDMIDEVWTGPQSKEYRNINRAVIKGVETEFRSGGGKKLGWSLGYTYLDAEDRTAGTRLENRARHQLTERISYAPDEMWNLSLVANTRLGELYRNSSMERVEKSYTTLDLAVDCRLKDKSSIYFGIDNLGNYKNDSLSYAGTLAYLGYRARF